LETIIPEVNVTIRGVKGETELPESYYNGCDHLVEGAVQCPIPKGKDTKWRLKLPVSLTDPLISLSLQISMYSNDGKAQFCFVVLGKIVAF
jgi:ML domain